MSKDYSASELILVVVISFLIAAPLNALIYAGTLEILWRWFLIQEYGTGPSLKAWFGISTIFSVLQVKSIPTKTEDVGPWWLLIRGILTALFVCGCGLLAGVAVRFVLDW